MSGSIDFRANILSWLAVLASNRDAQLKAASGLPEELRLAWEGCFFAIDDRGPMANDEGLAQFTPAERAALNEFDDYIWALPSESDPMWHPDALNDEPWPQVRLRAAELLSRLNQSA